MIEILKTVVLILKEIRALLTDLKAISDSGGIDLPVKINGVQVTLPPETIHTV